MGNCTLRAGIMEANAGTGPDTVNFAILPGGAQTIQPTADYPLLTDSITIDGSTQPGYMGTPIIEIDGSNKISAGGPFNFIAPHNLIQGLVINNFKGPAILIPAGADDTTVRNCYIGTDISGTVAKPNNEGIFIDGGSNAIIGGSNTSDRNIISGNELYGIQMGYGAHNRIENNYIGTNATGNLAVPNNQMLAGNIGGISIFDEYTIVKNNLVSGNNGYGIRLSRSNNSLAGNKIGVSANGMIALPNTKSGIELKTVPSSFPSAYASMNNTIGGSSISDRNIISGNGVDGINIDTWLTSSSGGYGMEITNTTIRNNYIGVGSDGVSAFPNQRNGISLFSADKNTITENTIAHNKGKGIATTFNSGKGQRNTFTKNSTYKNGSLGIDLKSDGITANNALDADNDANALQNNPTNITIKKNLASSMITGGLISTPSKTFILEIYQSPDNTPGQGKQFLASTTASTNTTGNASFSVSVPSPSLIKGSFITILAIDNKGNTSEFSVPVLVN
jgi:parallel beta-helix repeat protein